MSVLRRIGTLRIRPVAGSFTTRPLKTASKGKRKAHGDGLARQPVQGESYDTYADGVRRSVRNRSGGASSSADWSAAPKARSG